MWIADGVSRVSVRYGNNSNRLDFTISNGLIQVITQFYYHLKESSIFLFKFVLLFNLAIFCSWLCRPIPCNYNIASVQCEWHFKNGGKLMLINWRKLILMLINYLFCQTHGGLQEVCLKTSQTEEMDQTEVCLDLLTCNRLSRAKKISNG